MKQQPEVKGSRVMPKFIMYDGEGNYHRKPVQNVRNRNENIEFSWKSSLEKDDMPNYQKINSVDAASLKRKEGGTTSLPQISFNRKRMFEEAPPMKESVTQQHLVRYGKYSQRYIERTDIFRLPEDMKRSNISEGYDANSGNYGRFYYKNSQTPKFDGHTDVSQPQMTDYVRFDAPKPILKYHSLKSQLFTNTPQA